MHLFFNTHIRRLLDHVGRWNFAWKLYVKVEIEDKLNKESNLKKEGKEFLKNEEYIKNKVDLKKENNLKKKMTSKMKTTSNMKTTAFRWLYPAWAYIALTYFYPPLFLTSYRAK